MLIVAWSIAGAVRHVVFLFIVAGLIALLLNPIVRGLGRAWIPRGFAVALVYLTFAALVVLAGIALATVVVDQTKSASNRVDSYFTETRGQPPRSQAERDVIRFQTWLNRHHLEHVKVQKPGLEFLNNSGSKDVSRYSSKAIKWAEGAAVSIVFAALLDRADHRRVDLHAARHAAARPRDRQEVSASTGNAAAHVARRAFARPST